MRLVPLISMAVLACTAKTDPTAALDPVGKGRALFAAHCVACHGSDPKKDGPVGPALHGSPLELLRSKILERSYPEGYVAKRTTKIMPALVFLRDQIPALHAYLNAP